MFEASHKGRSCKEDDQKWFRNFSYETEIATNRFVFIVINSLTVYKTPNLWLLINPMQNHRFSFNGCSVFVSQAKSTSSLILLHVNNIGRIPCIRGFRDENNIGHNRHKQCIRGFRNIEVMYSTIFYKNQ